VLRLVEDLRPVSADEGYVSLDRLQAGPAWIWQWLMDLRQRGLVKLEALRNGGVKNSLEAEAVFQVPADKPGFGQLLEAYVREMEDLLGVGYARVETVPHLPEGTTVNVEVFDTRQEYGRCARSWKRRPDVGHDADYPDLSVRDAAVMKERQAGK
jgi:isoleucyl-tRNA synthetase